jgi:hypothetical protein
MHGRLRERYRASGQPTFDLHENNLLASKENSSSCVDLFRACGTTELFMNFGS